MKQITLQQLLPQVFTGRPTDLRSDVWLNSWIFHKGSYYLIEADSGTGKSSLCSFLYGERTDYTGQILFDEREASSFSLSNWMNLRRHSLSILFQDLRLFPELTALENVRIKNQLTGFKTEPQIAALFDRLAIADKRGVPVGRLSLGQQQRVALIRALCQPFDFLLLDEPVSHLDLRNAAVMSALILEEVERQGGGLIATSVGQSLPVCYHETLTL